MAPSQGNTDSGRYSTSSGFSSRRRNRRGEERTMPCCGDKRGRIPAATHHGGDRPARVDTALRAETSQTVRFRYEGKTGLTVLGPISGLRYRFGFPGATLDVDLRDAPSMTAAPHLRRMAP